VSLGWPWSGVGKQWRLVLETHDAVYGGQAMVMGIVTDVVQSDCPLLSFYSTTQKLLPPQFVIFFSKFNKYEHIIEQIFVSLIYRVIKKSLSPDDYNTESYK
jgi:hypothetical protein